MGEVWNKIFIHVKELCGFSSASLSGWLSIPKFSRFIASKYFGNKLNDPVEVLKVMYEIYDANWERRFEPDFRCDYHKLYRGIKQVEKKIMETNPDFIPAEHHWKVIKNF